MKWIVSTNDGDVQVYATDLGAELVNKGMQQQRPEHEELPTTLVDYLEGKNLLSSCTPYQVALMAFDLGYFYKVFLAKNKVTINDNQSNTSSGASSEIPSNSKSSV